MDEVEKREREWKRRMKVSGHGAWDLVVSHSKINTRRNCLQQYYYKYTKKYAPRRKAQQLDFGTLLHEYTEAYNMGNSWKSLHKQNIQKAKVEISGIPIYEIDTVRRAGIVMKGYVRHWKKQTRIDHRVAVEYQLPIIPLMLKPYRIGYFGFVDGIIQDDEGYVWVEERKTGANLADPLDRLMSPQSAMYQWCLQQLGWDIKGTVWDEIRSKPPTVPDVLKSGQITRKKSISTDVYTYKKALINNNQDPKDYRAEIALIRSKEPGKFFRRQWFPVNTVYNETILENVIYTSLDIIKRGKTTIKEHGFGCRFCDYRSLCDADSLGLDTDLIRRAEYTTAKQRKRIKAKEREQWPE